MREILSLLRVAKISSENFSLMGYPGILHQSMEPLEMLREQEVISRRIKALFEHYKIDPDSKDAWERLALSLAITNVPGFWISAGQGRMGISGHVDLFLIILTRIFLRSPKIKSEAEAIREIIDLGLLDGNYEMLRKRLRRAENRYKDILQDIYEPIDEGQGDYMLELLKPPGQVKKAGG
jgi:hypothetical protein